MAVRGREEKGSLTFDISGQNIMIEMFVIFFSRYGLILL
jgi:hypothetical protein